MSHVGVVVNPVSEPESANELVGILRNTTEVTVMETTEDDPGRAMAERLAGQGCSVVVAAGGDGTVRACAEGLLATDTSLAVLPLGTGNLLAANLALPDTHDEIVDLILNGIDRRIDVGVVNGETFLIMAGFGLDTTIMESTERDAKDRLGPLAYVLTALSHLDDEPVDARISIDGNRPLELAVATCLVGNMGKVLGAIDLFPEARFDDGTLDGLAIAAQGVLDWAAAAREALASDPDSDHVHRWTAEKVRVEFDHAQPYEMDGEARDAVLKMEISVRPRALSVRRAT